MFSQFFPSWPTEKLRSTVERIEIHFAKCVLPLSSSLFPRKNPRVLGSESLLRVSHFSNARTGDKKKQDAGVASAKIS